MKKLFLLAILLTVCLLVFSGCSCDHIWIEADCLNPKTCSRCAATEGEPLGHTPGEWNRTVDVVTCVATLEQHCSACNELISSDTAPLDTLISDNLFMFSPREFMERLTLIAEQHSYEFTYEFTSTSTGLHVLASPNGIETIIQFFYPNRTTMLYDDIDIREVWCVSLTGIGGNDKDFRQYFLMACDPTLDKNAASVTDLNLAASLLDAATNGELFGYYQENHLLYESAYIAEEVFGQDFSMSMFNIYASDFR